MDEANRRAEVRKVWYQRYPAEADRTGNNVYKFHFWLVHEKPHLVPKAKNGVDSYQLLQAELNGHFRD